MEQNSLITVQDVKSILNLWGEHKTLRPHKQYALHEVSVTDPKGNITTFICEDYIINDKLATFANVRVKDMYVDQSPIRSSIHILTSEDKPHTTPRWDQHTRSKFYVYGYKISGDKTINMDRVVGIESIEVIDGEPWYTVTQEMALIQSADNIVKYNERVVVHNKIELSEENVKKVIYEFEKQYVLQKNYTAWREWHDKTDKFPKWLKGIVKIIYPEPVNIESLQLTDEFKKTYLKHFKDTLEKFDQDDCIDPTYVYKYFGEESKSTIIDADYVSVE